LNISFNRLSSKRLHTIQQLQLLFVIYLQFIYRITGLIMRALQTAKPNTLQAVQNYKCQRHVLCKIAQSSGVTDVKK